MRINVSAWSIRRPVPAIVLFAVLTLLGTMSFIKLPVTRFPNIDVPIVSITVTQSGAAPTELESQVTKEVEDAVANIHRRQAHVVDDHRWLLGDGHGVPSGGNTRTGR